jgi:capsular polysaccharide biosynthesis protein
MENADKNSGKVTVKDLNLGNTKNSKNSQIKGNHDENTKVFNLKWHQDSSSARRRIENDTNEYGKNYDNNLLFKSPFEDQLL